MAKLPRIFQNLFGSGGDQSHFGQFGSRVAAPPGFTTKDPASIQALSAFVTNGWLDAINSANKAPFLEDMNGLFYLLFYQICYGMQEGIVEWNASTTYYVGSIVKKTGTTELYGSLVNNNTGNALPNQTANANWNYLNPASVAPGIISDFGGGTAAPFGYLLCDGTVYAQASFPALFAAIGSSWNIGGEGAGNFRVPDLRGRTTIGAGQGSGLTNRTLAQLIGEETHTLVVGEMPSHSHGVTDVGHAHFRSSTVAISVDSTGSSRIDTWGTGALPLFANDGNSRTSVNTTGIAINNAGGGGAHNIMQPSAVVTKIIKT